MTEHNANQGDQETKLSSLPKFPDTRSDLAIGAPVIHPREPWYYIFLERFTPLILWVGIVLCLVSFLGGAFYLIKVLDWNAVLAILLSFVFHGFSCLALVFFAALAFVALDAARNVRVLRQTGPNTPGPKAP
jgi:hypothetical protein